METLELIRDGVITVIATASIMYVSWLIISTFLKMHESSNAIVNPGVWDREDPDDEPYGGYPSKISTILCMYEEGYIKIILRDDSSFTLDIKDLRVDSVTLCPNVQQLVDRCSNLMGITSFHKSECHLFRYEDGYEVLDYRVIVSEDGKCGQYSLVNFDDCKQLRKTN